MLQKFTSSIVFFISLFLAGQPAYAGCPSFSRFISHGAYAVMDIRGKKITGCNIDTPLIPASILKIATALAALKLLGPEFRFTTQFFQDSQHNLYIKGTGDPLLISEEVNTILTALQWHGVERINAIFIDPGNFSLEYQVPGHEDSNNPYDAPVGPVVVNFNSVAVSVANNKHILSNEPQTPTLPIMSTMAKNYVPGKYRINICAGGCNPDARMAQYTTELFRALQRKAGIPGRGDTGIKKVPADARLVYSHRNSKNMKYLLSSMLRYSSNFIANLVYLRCGAERFGFPATWRKADRAVHEVLVQLLGAHTASTIVQEDGAGLSRKNRITSRAMLALLQSFRPYSSLLAKKMGVPTKSGSMKGVYNYAGYLNDGSCYVIMLNQQYNGRKAILRHLLKK